MFVDINEYVECLNRLKITANQFLLCYLLFTDQKVEVSPNKYAYIKKGTGMANLYKYASQNTKWTSEEIQDLVSKNYIKDKNVAGSIYPDYLEITEEFSEKVFIKSNLFSEFWEAYPPLVPNFNHPNGPKIKLKICDPDELEKLYIKKVVTIAEHKLLMEVLLWAKENNQLNINIENFVKSNHWRDLKSEMDKYVNTTNMRLGN
jgi:hypothetical protein